MFAPVYAPPPPQFAGAPVQGWTPPRPVNVPVAAKPAPLPAPRIRAQAPDEPRSPQPAYIRMPTPEQLGVSRNKPAAGAISWTEVHQQLDGLGAKGVQREHLETGGYRVSCLLPTAQTDRHHRIAVEAASEAEAVRLVLDKAHDWAAQQRTR